MTTVVIPRDAVKICGLREPDHAVAAVAAGADLLGFIFAPARRQVSPEQAGVCLRAARDQAATEGRAILAVGVFVNATASEMNEAADTAGLDLVQLHGDEAPTSLAALTRPVLKALRPRPGASVADVLAVAAPYQAAANAPVAFLLDAYDPVAHGGTGARADWPLAADLARNLPLLLAGGLDPANVVEAIATVHPLGVDVSSGVETDGIKDVVKIAAFVAAAKPNLT